MAPWSATARCAAFAAEVEAFAAVFWSLAPAERRARHDSLWGFRCGPAAARLGELRAGLDVVPITGSGPAVQEVVRLVQDLFVLPARARAARRMARLKKAVRPREWDRAARDVLR
ncbi:MAG TPA: hypothetical protein VH092_08295, partial [Urbifossiella sp.]|nr:hypothetical protein [Urbifossiella sp.]